MKKKYGGGVAHSMTYDWVSDDVAVPDGLWELLRSFSVEVLRRQLGTRDEIIKFGSAWFSSVADSQRASPVHTMSPQDCVQRLLRMLKAQDTDHTGILPHDMVKHAFSNISLSFTWLQRLVAYSCLYEADDGSIQYKEGVAQAVAEIYKRGTEGSVEHKVDAVPTLMHGFPTPDYDKQLADAISAPAITLPAKRSDFAAAFDDSSLGLSEGERNMLMALLPSDQDNNVNEFDGDVLRRALHTYHLERVGPMALFSLNNQDIAQQIDPALEPIQNQAMGTFIPLSTFKQALLSIPLGLTNSQVCALLAMAAGQSNTGSPTVDTVRDLAPGFIRKLRTPERVAALEEIPLPTTVMGRTRPELTQMVADVMAEAGDSSTIHSAVALRLLTTHRFEVDEAVAIVATCELQQAEVEVDDLVQFAFDTLIVYIREKNIQSALQ